MRPATRMLALVALSGLNFCQSLPPPKEVRLTPAPSNGVVAADVVQAQGCSGTQGQFENALRQLFTLAPAGTIGFAELKARYVVTIVIPFSSIQCLVLSGRPIQEPGTPP